MPYKPETWRPGKLTDWEGSDSVRARDLSRESGVPLEIIQTMNSNTAYSLSKKSEYPESYKENNMGTVIKYLYDLYTSDENNYANFHYDDARGQLHPNPAWVINQDPRFNPSNYDYNVLDYVNRNKDIENQIYNDPQKIYDYIRLLSKQMDGKRVAGVEKAYPERYQFGDNRPGTKETRKQIPPLEMETLPMRRDTSLFDLMQLLQK